MTSLKITTSTTGVEKAFPNLKTFKKQTKVIKGDDTLRKIDYAKNTLYVVTFNSSDKYAMLKFKEDMDYLYYNVHANMNVQIKVSSPGGSVVSYAYATSLITKLKKLGVYIIVNVDSMACSGGYMMAAVADQIIANPMAFVGSIGVVASVPDISKFLEDNGVNYNTYTAGECKRTITPTSAHTEEDIAKFNKQLAEIHTAFIDHIKEHRTLDDKYTDGNSYLAKNVVGADAFVDRIGDSESVRDIFYMNGGKVLIVNTEVVEQGKKRRGLFNIISKIEAVLDVVQLKLEAVQSGNNLNINV